MREASTCTVHCDLCGGPSHKLLYQTAEALPLVRCEGCGLLFLAFDQHSARVDYWATGARVHNWEVYASEQLEQAVAQVYLSRLATLKHLIGRGEPMCSPSGRDAALPLLIDYGCGLGTFLSVARAHGWRALGLDTSRPAVDYVRMRKGIPAWTLEEWETQMAPKEAADAVTMWDVLEHVQSPTQTLQFVSHLLKPGGLLAIETPRAQFILRALSLRLHRLLRVDLARYFFYPDHRFYFSRATLERLLRATGFGPLIWERTTTPWAKIQLKLQNVHRATRGLLWGARAALALTRLLGGNKLIVYARRERP